MAGWRTDGHEKEAESVSDDSVCCSAGSLRMAEGSSCVYNFYTDSLFLNAFY